MVAQGWFPVSTRSGKVASMGGPACSLGLGLEVWDCRGHNRRQGTRCHGGEALDSGNCFGPSHSLTDDELKLQQHAGGRQCQSPSWSSI